jgi:hypothetical protein
MQIKYTPSESGLLNLSDLPNPNSEFDANLPRKENRIDLTIGSWQATQKGGCQNSGRAKVSHHQNQQPASAHYLALDLASAYIRQDAAPRRASPGQLVEERKFEEMEEGHWIGCVPFGFLCLRASMKSIPACKKTAQEYLLQ